MDINKWKNHGDFITAEYMWEYVRAQRDGKSISSDVTKFIEDSHESCLTVTKTNITGVGCYACLCFFTNQLEKWDVFSRKVMCGDIVVPGLESFMRSTFF